MISFIAAVAALIIGYLIYGKIAERNFCPDERQTPAVRINDGVDYVPMPTWKVFLIQVLNIAGTGPIFGALSGALFGPIVYLWIVLGCIFAGSVHDYYCGMIVNLPIHADMMKKRMTPKELRDELAKYYEGQKFVRVCEYGKEAEYNGFLSANELAGKDYADILVTGNIVSFIYIDNAYRYVVRSEVNEA